MRTRSLRRALAIGACLALVAPASALAGQPRLLGSAQSAEPTVTAGVDGAFHAVFNDGPANLLVYCRITPASIGDTGQLCTQRTAIAFNDTDGSPTGAPGKAWIVADEPGVLRLVLAQYVSGRSWMWTSTDGGVSFAGPQQLADPNHGTDSERPLLLPAVQRVLLPSWNPSGYVADNALDGSEGGVEGAKAALADGGQRFLFYNLSLGATPDGVVATADSLEVVAFWRLPAGASGNDPGAWGQPTGVTAGTDSTMHAGGGVPWLGYTTGPGGKRRLEMRRWNGSRFGAPLVVERTDGYLADTYVAGNGVPGVAYRRNGTGLRFGQLRPGADAFTVRTVVRNDDVFHNLVMAHDGAGRGVAVWTSGDAVFAADLTEVFDPSVPRQHVTQTKDGTTLGFNLPGSCVRPGGSALLTTTGQGKARLLKVRYRVGAATATDEAGPWGARLPVPASAAGSSLPAKAVMTLRRVKGGKLVGPSFTRTLIGTVRVCGG